ncbi:hypothetical protein UYO_3059 [Lachnospiraceae bacterium JC7]|nr:hypothetical protein UYO_3059 [Lachnospiraceae bacterium JC7]
MHLIEETGKKQILEWQKEQQNRILNDRESECSSFYSKFDNGNNIIAYSIDSVRDLTEMLSEYLPDYSKEFISKLSLMAYKERLIFNTKTISEEDEGDSVHKEDFKIPDFVYVL